jgi:hypothetical protein
MLLRVEKVEKVKRIKRFESGRQTILPATAMLRGIPPFPV